MTCCVGCLVCRLPPVWRRRGSIFGTDNISVADVRCGHDLYALQRNQSQRRPGSRSVLLPCSPSQCSIWSERDSRDRAIGVVGLGRPKWCLEKRMMATPGNPLVDRGHEGLTEMADSLTEVERQLLVLLVTGNTTAVMADQLGYSTRHIRRLISDLSEKLGAGSRSGLAFLAGRLRLVMDET